VPDADVPIVLVEPSYENAGPLELPEADATRLALERRLDLRVEVGRILDAQRTVAVAADQLRADLTLLGSASSGARRTLATVGADDADIRLDEVQYSALLGLDLPFERTRERNLYRNSLIAFEQSVRNAQALEDLIKLEIRTILSDLLESRESIQIQAEAVTVAQRRVDSTNLLLQAGRVDIRDVLEAQESLVSAQNLLTAALVNYRVGELDLQRDLGVLEVNEQGLWREYTPGEKEDHNG
jgi:outer membrane protein TolC